MYLNYLPDEMLTSILKYAENDTVRNARKLSQRMDRIAKRADLGTRASVDTFSVFHEPGYLKTRFYGNIGVRNNLFRLSMYSCDRNDLEMYLSKIVIVKTFGFQKCSLNDEVLAVFSRHRKSLRLVHQCVLKKFLNTSRELKTMHLYGMKFMVYGKDAKDIFQTIFPNLESLKISNLENHDWKLICNSKILECRTWKYLNIYSSHNHYLNDEFLLKIAPNCGEFRSSCVDAFTVLGAIQLLKKCFVAKSHYFEVGRVTLGSVPFLEREDLLKEEFGSLQVKKDNYSNSINTFFEITIVQSTYYTHCLKFSISP